MKNIKIAGLQKQSFIDYPGKIAAVIFLAGCNMRCVYCHNQQLWSTDANQIPWTSVVNYLRTHRDFLDAVVVTGGEPTVYPDLLIILRQLRRLGLLIKLDTNGSRPDVVQQVLTEKLVDLVALDVKAPADKYLAITGMSIDCVLQTLNLLQQQKVMPYQIRTTVCPALTVSDLQKIGQNIVNGAPFWQIQTCRFPGAIPTSELQKIAGLLKVYTQHLVVV